MLTSFGDDEALFDAIMAGAAGYVLKQIRGTDLVGAVRTVASGESMLDPEAASRVMRRMREQAERSDPLAALTGQERKILELIGEGLTNRQIGEQLYLAEKTVKNYVSGLFTKLGMERRTQAAAYAARVFGDDTAAPARRLTGRTAPGGRRTGYCCSGAGRATPVRCRRPRRARPACSPPSAAARSARLARPLRRPPGLIPEPLSWTVSTRSRPPPASAMDTATSARVALACRATFDRASRSTASRCSSTAPSGNRIQPARPAAARGRSPAARSSARPGSRI